MKEYFTKTIYEEPNLIIGTNGKSLIFGQDKNWIIMDRRELVRIEKHFSSGGGSIDFPGLQVSRADNCVKLSQYDGSIYITKGLLTQELLK